jgi:hypothetical protein
MDNTLPIAFRLAGADDYNYIIQTWGRLFHESFPANFIPNHIYFEHQNALINRILSKVTPVVACLDDDPNQIVGWLAAQQHDESNLLVHYGVVKGIYRRMGIMKSLLEQFHYQDKNIIVTHYFGLFKQLKDRYNLIYDPTILENYV